MMLFGALLLAVACAAVHCDEWKHVCTNGKDPVLLSTRNYLKEFASGPCSPAVLLPGILASVLRVEVTDCEAFRAADPATFAACNWTDCSGPQAPLPEYQLWVPAPESPMTVLSPTELNKECFAGLIEVPFSRAAGFQPVQKPGLRVTVKGASAQTKLHSKCAAQGVENFIPGVPNPEMTQYLNAMVARLEHMGFRSGLTYQAVPYDYRLSSGFDGASRSLPALLALMKKLTNKRVVVAAHSMGNMKAAVAFWNMPQPQKDDTVYTYLAIAPPFLGSAKPVAYTTCGSNEFFFPFNFGIDMKTWKRLAGTFPAIFELLPPPTWTTQRAQPWMQKLLQRLQYENGTSDDPVFRFLPARDQACYPAFADARCRSGLDELDYFASYLGLRVNNSNLRDWLINHSFSNFTADIFSLFDARFESLPNLGVPAALVYSYVVPTEGKFVFNQDPKVTWQEDKFCSAKNMSWSPWNGDETVPASSVVTAGLKWAMEFEAGAPNAKPVKLVDVCSAVNVKKTPYDGAGPGGSRVMSQVEYQGLPCDCSQGKYKHCTHIDMLHNPDLVDYLANTVLTKDAQPVSDMVNGMTDAQLADFHDQCRLFEQVRGALDQSEELELLRSVVGRLADRLKRE